jgi:hypothetical protein
MSWVRWAAPSAIVISIAAPAHAVRYLSVEQAQKLAFPDATRFVEAHVIFTPVDVAGIERRSGQKVRATLSSRHVTEGVKRILALYETCLR